MEQPVNKPTNSIHVHFLNEENNTLDEWYISRRRNEFVISMFYPQDHAQWLPPYDIRFREYEIFVLPMTRDEAEYCMSQLVLYRKMKPANGTAKPPVDDIRFDNNEIMMMKHKHMGFSYKDIAAKIPCSEHTVKQFFSRGARNKGFASGKIMVHYALSNKLF